MPSVSSEAILSYFPRAILDTMPILCHSFSRSSEVPSSDVEVDALRDISEAEVKVHIREIIVEPFDQLDWGGELNDLFTNQIEIDGRRIDSAFMLKGPSVDGPLRMRDAGA